MSLVAMKARVKRFIPAKLLRFRRKMIEKKEFEKVAGELKRTPHRIEADYMQMCGKILNVPYPLHEKYAGGGVRYIKGSPVLLRSRFVFY